MSSISVPSSLNKTFAPPASRIISVVAFNVIDEPLVISAITGVVSVLFVRVCVAAIPVIVSVVAG